MNLNGRWDKDNAKCSAIEHNRTTSWCRAQVEELSGGAGEILVAWPALVFAKDPELSRGPLPGSLRRLSLPPSLALSWDMKLFPST